MCLNYCSYLRCFNSNRKSFYEQIIVFALFNTFFDNSSPKNTIVDNEESFVKTILPESDKPWSYGYDPETKLTTKSFPDIVLQGTMNYFEGEQNNGKMLLSF